MGEYDAIIDHPQMSMINRAAQFRPFAALTGYDAVLEETVLLTDGRIAQMAAASDGVDYGGGIVAHRLCGFSLISANHTMSRCLYPRGCRSRHSLE